MSKRRPSALVIADTLDKNRLLAPVMARLKLHQRLLSRLKELLPQPLGNHCLACVLDTQGRLTLYVDTSAWASQLRFHQPQVLPELNKIAPLQQIRLRVLLPVGPVERRAQSPRVPDPRILAQLEQNADSVEDLQIRCALQKLTRTMRTAFLDDQSLP